MKTVTYGITMDENRRKGVFVQIVDDAPTYSFDDGVSANVGRSLARRIFDEQNMDEIQRAVGHKTICPRGEIDNLKAELDAAKRALEEQRDAGAWVAKLVEKGTQERDAAIAGWDGARTNVKELNNQITVWMKLYDEKHYQAARYRKALWVIVRDAPRGGCMRGIAADALKPAKKGGKK